MTLHGRPRVTVPHLLTALLVLALIPTVVFAYIPPPGSSPTMEVVSPRTYRVMDENGNPKIVPDLAKSGQVLARLWLNATPEQVQRMLDTTGCSLLHRYKTPGVVLLGLPANTSVNAGISMLRMQLPIKSVGPDRVAYMDRTPNDPQYSQQYHWPLIDAPAAWDTTTGSSSLVVGVVDSGMDLVHEDLQAQVWVNTDEVAGNSIDDDGNGYVDDVNGWDFINGNNDPMPGDGNPGTADEHGTHVAGLIGAASDNGIGVTGHSWECQLMPAQVFNNGSSLWSVIIGGYEYCRDNGASVINMSLGGGWVDEFTDPIAQAYDMDIVTVVSAGNSSFGDAFRYFFTDDPDTWMSPVCNDGENFTDNHVIGVGATDDADVCAFFTCLDQSSRDYVDVMAPGVNIYSTVYYNPTDGFLSKYGYMSGTSMACPITAGLAALVRSTSSSLSAMGVGQQIISGCENIDAQNPVNVGFMGAGRINSAASLTDKAPGPPRSVQALDTPNDTGGSITVTWNLSLDDGRGFNDVVRYEIWRSTDSAGPFDHLGDVAKGTRSYVDATVTDYVQYYYQVYACDASQSTASAVTQPAVARDDIAPDAVTASAADTLSDNGGSITVTWSAYAPPADFLEYHVYRSDSTFDDVSADGVTLLATVSNSSQKQYVDATTEDNKDYYYAVTCLDMSQPANERKSVTAAGPVRSNPNYAFGFPPGTVLMGIGLTMQNNKIEDVFDMSSGLSFARWDPSAGTDGAYIPYAAGDTSTFLRLSPGHGVWMRSAAPIALSLSGAAATGDVRVDFVPGWNQLANPYVGDVDVSADGTGVRVGGTFYTLAQSNEEDFTRDYFWTYDSFANSYRLVSPTMGLATKTIQKGQGFFFLSNRIGQLVLKNPTAPSTAAVATKPAAAPADEWSLRLAASVEGAADTDNFLGVSSRAAAISDIASPPPATDGPDLYFTAEGGRAATDYVKSLGQGHVWTAEVSCARPNALIKLTWPDLTSLPNDCRPILTDTVTGRSIYMRTSAAYTFKLGPEEASRRFEVSISTKAGDTLVIQSLQASSAPGNVNISYVLSAPATVQVEIRNVAGRLIRRLGSGATSPAGANSLVWNCQAEGGQKVPAGQYVVCVTGCADNGQLVKAMQVVSVRR